MAAILNLAILDSAIFQEKILTNSFSLNLMMAAIMNSVMLDSDIAMLDSDISWIQTVIFSQIQSKTLSLHSDSDSN